jgi:tubulin polyglutamylase TTLL6/13
VAVKGGSLVRSGTITIGNGTNIFGSVCNGPSKLILNVLYLSYDIIKDIAKEEFSYKLIEDEEAEWDMTWNDHFIPTTLLSKMKPHQRVNHYPGMYHLSRKNYLARNLMRMHHLFPEEYDFFPPTWILP